MLRSLTEYYDCLTNQPNSPLAPDCFSKVSVNYNAILSKDGELKEIVPYVNKIELNGKVRDVGKEELFPFRYSVPGICAETIEHREKYIFGIDYDKKSKAMIITKNSLLAFQKNKEKNLDYLNLLDSPIINAYKNFLNRWVPEEETQNKILLSLDKNYSGAKFVVTLSGENKPLNQDEQVKEKWKERWENKEISDDAIIGQCSISGKKGEIARIHDNLKGIKGGLATGVNIVCLKTSAFWSYGKEQSYNSSVSQEVMEKYTKAFNYLANSKNHYQVIGDTTYIYFALTKDDESPYMDMANFSLFGLNVENDSNGNREVLENNLSSIFKELSNGTEANWSSINIDEKTNFCILGVKPNSSRLAIKMFERNSFGNLMENVQKHNEDMRFSSNDKQIPLWVFQKELNSPVGNAEIQPDLTAKILQSILKGIPYPSYLLQTVVKRAKTDYDSDGKSGKQKFVAVNRNRARIIKACLIRLKIMERGKFNMLNEESKDCAYNCGRLFAVLEMLQSKAIGTSVNATIKDKFFASACSTPYLVFPRLLKLSQNHIGKLDGGLKVYYDKLIQSLIMNLDQSFPKTLNMEKQGTFILGYYQQREKLFEKSEKN